jgi:hypothetical protein
MSLIITMRVPHTQAQGVDVTPAPTLSTYRDLLDGEIRGLSEEQIDAYREGSGMGLALPAELNGYPGPRHVLDLATDLALTEAQQETIQALYDQMRAQAIELGEQILIGEAALEEAFRHGGITIADLEYRLSNLGELNGRLRFMHLQAHIATLDVLTPHQAMLYNRLRGYSENTQMGDGENSGHNH